MSRRLFLIVTLSLFSTGTLVSPPIASAETPLTRATVQALRNQVQLIFKNRVTRTAQTADTMTPGDSLATARQAFAELRFNDNSLARIGERTLFQFVPNTRNFYLGNGTALLLIPPGQGRTNVRTPNAAAGIRGSALFVRYNEDTNTTIVGALTDSRIEVSNGENSQVQTLKAGQLAVVIQNHIVQVYNFDLNTFYQTSALVKDLDLPLRNAAPSADPGIAAVQAETAQALREQTPLAGQISENPAFVSLNPAPGLQAAVTPGSANQITLTPSGLDLSTARQTLIANPTAQTFTGSTTGAQSGTAPLTQLSIPNPASVNAVAVTQVSPTTLLTVPSGSSPTNPAANTPSLPTPPVAAATAPIQTTPPAPSAAVSPTPTGQTPIATSSPPATPTGSTIVQPSTPATTLPVTSAPAVTVQPPSPAPAPAVTVQPSTPVPTVTVQPSTPVPVVTVTAPTPTPVTTPISNPVARPDPVATPAPTPVTQIAPALTSPAADTPAAQQRSSAPTTVVPAASTTVVQTGTAGTPASVPTATTGGVTVTPASTPSNSSEISST